MAGEVQGYRGGELVVLDGAAQGGGTFHQPQLNARIREHDLLVLTRLGRHLLEHPALVGGKPLERGAPHQPAQHLALGGELADLHRVPAMRVEPQLHEPAADDVAVGLEALLDRRLQQDLGTLAAGLVGGRCRCRRRPVVKGGAPERLQRQTGLFHVALQLVAGVAQVARARAETPHQLAQAGKRLGVAGGGDKQHGALRRILLEVPRHLEQGGRADGLVGAGGLPGHVGGAVVKRLHQEQFFFAFRGGAGNDTGDVLRDRILPGRLGREPHRAGQQPLRRRLEVAEGLPQGLHRHPEARKLDRRKLELLLEIHSGGFPAVHIDQGARPQAGRQKPVLGGVELHQQHRPLDQLAVQAGQCSVPGVDERTRNPRGGDGLGA